MLDLFTQPTTFNLILVLIASMYILFKAADYLIIGISNYAKKLGLSDATIGLIVIAFAASLPDMITSVAGFTKNSSIGLGVIVGCSLVHAGLALGGLLIFTGKMPITKSVFQENKIKIWIFLMIPFILLIFDGELGRIDGIILVMIFIFYIGRLIYLEGKTGKVKKKVKLKKIWKDVFVFLGCLAALILSGRYLVYSSIQLAQKMNIPAYFISITIIAIGVTLPDLAVELKSIIKGHAHMGLGDLIGSLMIALLFFLGIVAIITPIQVEIMQILNALIFLIITITIITYFLGKKELTRKHGIVLVGMYLVFILIELVKVI